MYHAKQKGFEEGLKKGKKEASITITIVKNLLTLNIPVEAISKATGLNIDEIEKLK